jgi:hypothetical protein
MEIISELTVADLQIGTKVSNKNGWEGVIVGRPEHWNFPPPSANALHEIVYVEWEELKKMAQNQSRDCMNIKDPVVTARPGYLTLLD